MLEIRDTERLYKVKKFLRTNPQYKESWRKNISYLANYACHGERKTKCILFNDFAPLSFAFRMVQWIDDKWEYWFNGGLIFHDVLDRFGDGGMPTLSVCLEPVDGWAVHT